MRNSTSVRLGIRIDILEFTGADQTLDDTHVLRSQFRPAEQPGFAAHGDRPQRSLQVIGIQRNFGVFQEDAKRLFPSAHVT